MDLKKHWSEASNQESKGTFFTCALNVLPRVQTRTPSVATLHPAATKLQYFLSMEYPKNHQQQALISSECASTLPVHQEVKYPPNVLTVLLLSPRRGRES